MDADRSVLRGSDPGVLHYDTNGRLTGMFSTWQVSVLCVNIANLT